MLHEISFLRRAHYAPPPPISKKGKKRKCEKIKKVRTKTPNGEYLYRKLIFD